MVRFLDVDRTLIKLQWEALTVEVFLSRSIFSKDFPFSLYNLTHLMSRCSRNVHSNRGNHWIDIQQSSEAKYASSNWIRPDTGLWPITCGNSQGARLIIRPSSLWTEGLILNDHTSQRGHPFDQTDSFRFKQKFFEKFTFASIRCYNLKLGRCCQVPLVILKGPISKGNSRKKECSYITDELCPYNGTNRGSYQMFQVFTLITQII